MSEPLPHYCSACGLPHGTSTGKSDEVRIAEIQRDKEIELAKIARGEIREIVQTGAETEIAVAEIEAAGDEAVSENIGEALAGGGGGEGEPVPIIVNEPAGESEPAEEEPSMTPRDEGENGSAEPEPAARKSHGYWP